MKTVRLLQPPRASRLPAKLSGVNKMNDTRIMGAICFAGGDDLAPDPSGAAVALRRAGFEVTMMPERFRPYLAEPDDYFMEASKAGTQHAIKNEISAIVGRYQGDCWECGPILSDHVPFDGLFARAEQEERSAMKKQPQIRVSPEGVTEEGKVTAQSRIVEGVPISGSNYDELLREAVRVALRMDMDPAHDDWDDLYERIGRLIAAYIESPEGKGEDTCILMKRLAACVSDVIPMAIRKGLVPYTPSRKE